MQPADDLVTRRLCDASTNALPDTRDNLPQSPSQDGRFIDGEVNNVDLVRPASPSDVTLPALDKVMRINLRPTLLVMQAALPDMKARLGGVVEHDNPMDLSRQFS